MRHIAIVVVALICSATLASAQVSDAEYLKKLDELKHKKPTTAPAEKPIAWKLKDNAPPAVVAWFRQLEELKARQVGSLLTEIWTLERPGRVRTAAESMRLAEAKVLYVFVKNDEYFIAWPPALGRERGEIGTVNGFRVLQVIDEANCLIEKGPQVLWVADGAAAGLVDGQPLAKSVMVITGTKQYTTKDGATRTVLQVEPVTLEAYLDNWPARLTQRGENWPGMIPHRPAEH